MAEQWENGEIQNEEGEDDYNFDQDYPYENAPVEVYEDTSTQMSMNQPASRMGVSSRMGPPASRGGADGPARPMTSIGSAGYNSGRPQSGRYDAGGPGGRGPVKKLEISPEIEARNMEKKVHSLIDESAVYTARGEPRVALEKAKEAIKKEKALTKYRESKELHETQNPDLTYVVYFNLANQYHKNGLYNDALNTYNIIVKNKNFVQAGRMRVNMGNIHYERGNYKDAIKMYRMAMDQIQNTNKEIRFRIMRNIGCSFIKLGKFQDAVQAFETIMEASPDYRSGLNLLLSQYIFNNPEKMKSSYSSILTIGRSSFSRPEGAEEEEEETEEENLGPNDALRQEIRERNKFAERYIILGSKLIAPHIEKDFATGFDFVVDTLHATKNSDLANELEISKALTFMKKKDVTKAIETLKGFERKDHTMAGPAATNLAFLYFLEQDYRNSDKYANIAIKADKYNANALVNKGNIYFVKKKLEQAKEMYQNAIDAESDCVEALYNLGLVHKKLDQHDKALLYFNKLQQVIPNHPEVLYQIASNLEGLGKDSDIRAAEDRYKALLAVVPSDPVVLQRLGALYAKSDDEIAAHQSYMESYRYYPADLNVISWLGAYYVRGEVYEKAIEFFKRAAQLEPQDIKWLLMIASCYRRMRAYRQAKEYYEQILLKDPNNVESIRYLVQLCNDLGMKDQVDVYVTRLRKAEQAAAKSAEGTPNTDTADNLVQQQQKIVAPKTVIKGASSLQTSYVEASAPPTSRKPEPAPSKAPTFGSSGFSPMGMGSSSGAPAPQLQRPSTANLRKKQIQTVDDDFMDADISDEMLPL
ncbi:intraflagellar transport protein [Planoprotostelium fungivorum]|uniref:Intraflagellar transport protein n=1 Tax=Planoprotostelium fungivorum TaxID=1890364 RepID=A0A2P6MYZ1_9EUKA|nr:intraflagellar transport protein [Planoprotostelium fungivorum]